MRRITAFLASAVVFACHSGVPAPISTATAPDTSLVGTDIRKLAGDAWEGRGTGTPGNDSAAAYIARRYQALGLEPLTWPAMAASPGNRADADAKAADRWNIPVSSACTGRAGRLLESCARRFLQPFVARSMEAAHAGLPSAFQTQNVAAFIPGSDASLRGQIVVLGAHFDHLGRSSFGAQDPERAPEIHNGADDNASGTVAVMELARLLKRHPTRRSIAIVNFSGEELGLLGSAYFADHAPFALDSVQAMLNFDMVGRLRDDKLLVYGVATATELPDIVRAANTQAPLFKISAIGDGFGPSDHSSFYAKNVSVLHFFTDVHEDYHRVTDDADKIDLGGIARVVALAERITRDLGDRQARLTFVKSTAPVSSNSSRTGPQPSLGTIPDMGATDVAGMRISGVRGGSPADAAGMKAGDIIVELGGVPVKDLYSYSDALYSHKPGDVVSIVVKRGSERVTFQVTLGKR
ncbi:MAG: M28 family peptidase [Gemmatimonadaceae bacterium]